MFHKKDNPKSLQEHAAADQETSQLELDSVDQGGDKNDENAGSSSSKSNNDHIHDKENGVGNIGSNNVGDGGSYNIGSNVVFTDVDKKVLSSESLPIVMDKNKVVKLITVIDSGGQPEYIDMLPAISNYHTFNFIVLDMTKPLDDPVMVHYKSKHDKKFKDYALHYSNLDMVGLLMSLTCESLNQPTNEKMKFPRKSYIGFVGTHKDELEESQQIEITDKINKTLDQLTKGVVPVLPADNHDGILFPVDNTTAGDNDTEDPIVKKIRQRVDDEMTNINSTNQLKISWMILELELQELHLCTGKKYITYEEYKELAIKKASMVPEEVDESLEHFHFLGVLLYFKKVGSHHYVIIDHQWLFDSLAMIMHLSPDKFQDNEYRKQFKEKGLLAKHLLCYVHWDGEPCLEYFFNLLIHLKLVAIVELEGTEYYYMPYLFPSTKHYTDKYRFLYSEPLLVQFSSSFLPRGFFCSLVVHLLENRRNDHKWDLKLHDTEHFSNVITFELPEGSFLRMHDKILYLEIQIRHFKGQLEVDYSNILPVLSQYFEDVCRELKFNHNNLQYGFLCHDGKSNDDHIVVVNPFEIPFRYTQKCCKKCPNSMKLERLHTMWFDKIADTSLQQFSDHSKPLHTGCYSSTRLDHILKQEPKMGTINKVVVPRIQAEWEDVAFALCYEIPTMEAIKAEHKGNPKKCCRELFIDWLKTNHGVGPKTWSTLMEKLKEVEELAAATNEIMNELEKL